MPLDPILQSLLDSADALALEASPPPTVASILPAGAVAPGLGGLFPELRGEGTVDVSTKLFVVVVIDCLDKTVCFGSIGAGGSFCVKRNCTTKSHSSSKVRFLGWNRTMVFIQRINPTMAFLEPNLDLGNVSDNVVEGWRNQRLSLAAWILEFQAADSVDDDQVTSEDIEEETRFLMKADKLKTPSKKRREDDEVMETDFVVLGWRGEPYQRTLPEEGSVELENQIAVGFKKGVVTRAVAGIESKVEGLSKGMVELSQLTHNRFVTIEESVRLGSGFVQTLKSKIGKEFVINERFEAPTMWGTMSFIADELIRVDGVVTRFSDDIEPLKDTIGILQSHIADAGGAKDATDKLVKIVSIMMSRIQGLTPEIQTLKVAMEGMKLVMDARQNEVGDSESIGYHGWPAKVRAVKPTSTTAVDDLMSMVCDDDASSVVGNDRNSNVTPMKRTESGTRAMDLHQDERLSEHGGTRQVPSLMGNDFDYLLVIKQLVEDVRVLKSTSEDTSIKFGNLCFRNIHECSNWIENHFTGLRYGLIMDPLVMLERIYGDDEVDAVSFMKTLESRMKLKIETAAEASALNALRHSRPRIFHKGRPTMVNASNKSRLNLLSSHSEWKSGGEGVKAFIVQKMNTLHASIAGDISFEFRFLVTYRAATEFSGRNNCSLWDFLGCIRYAGRAVRPYHHPQSTMGGLGLANAKTVVVYGKVMIKWSKIISWISKGD